MNRNKNTKLIAILLLAAMLFSIMPVSAFATDVITFEVDGMTYTVLSEEDKTVSLTKGKNVSEVSIPANVKDYNVTTIGNHAFYECKKLTSITIPNSVTSIGDSAFAFCTGLTSINIPASVTSIGDNVFYDCDALTSISISDSVTTIGDFAFRSCNSLDSITIPEKVTSIGHGAFEHCESLTSITIPENVTSIGMQAFNGCKRLTSINIPKKVTSIGEEAFLNCTGLTSITIPASVTSIGKSAFEGCTGLTSITIPASVTSIGQEAFLNCTTLSSITFDIDSQLNTIGGSAFAGCTSLGTVNVPCIWDGSLYTFGTNVTVNREHKDADKDHICDHHKDVVGIGTCEDKGFDHHCDYGCNIFYGEHKAADDKHTCDYCGEAVTQCIDADSDYTCDICGAAVGSRPSSGGGFSGSYNYPVKADEVDGADVTLSDSYAVKGETVTITVKPDAGRQVDEVIVTDADGKVIPVTKVDDNQYTFTMPAGRVHIAVTTEAADYDLRIVMQINNKNIVANNQTITNDVTPVIVEGRTLVPVRIVTELLGGTAHWDEESRTVTLKIDGKVLTLVIGEEIPGYGTSATIINNRTYVPIRWIIENLGGHVTWIADTQQIVIEK